MSSTNICNYVFLKYKMWFGEMGLYLKALAAPTEDQIQFLEPAMTAHNCL